MSNAADLYALSLEQVAKSILAVGEKSTVIAVGDMGSGKTSGLGSHLRAARPNNTYIHFDCTNKDIQDLSVPKFMEKLGSMVSDYVSFVPNEELGVHLGKPVTINFDEFLKAPKPVQKAVRRVMLERVVNGIALPEGSIVFGTSNLSGEGLGDSLEAHQRNAVIFVRMRKPNAEEFISFGINNGFNATTLGWARENPHAFQSFTDVKNPRDNEVIFHPADKARTAFVTGRSLEKASDVLHAREAGDIDDTTTMAMLIGCIGPVAAQDMMAFTKLSDKLPKRDEILKSPNTAPVPENVAALCMVVFRALSSMDREFIDPWMTYMERLSMDAQGLFVNGVRAERYAHQHIVMTNKKFSAWCQANNVLFTADQ